MILNSLVGVGLRPAHYPHLENSPQIHSNFFEAISENYMNTEGRPLEMLLKVRSHFPVALHGVSLSIGSDQGIDKEYLKKLKILVERTDPIIVSDHICWSRSPSGNSHDLLPLPITHEALQRVTANIDLVQDFLGRQILLENISYYLRFKENEITETDFVVEMCKKTGCKILLDLNNIHVNSVNHGFDPVSFVNEIPPEIVGQIHLAGPSQEEGYLFDTHASHVPDEVWSLFKYVTDKGLRVPVIVEWDEDIPDFEELEKEVLSARKILLRKDNVVHETPAQ